MREYDDGCFRRSAGEVVLEPRELIGTEPAEAAGFQVEHVDQRDEVHTMMIEAVPAAGVRVFFAKAAKELGAVVADDVMFARYIERALRARRAHQLRDRVELFGLRK